MLEGGARDVEAPQEQVKVLRVGRAVGVGVNTRCFCVGLAFDLQRIAVALEIIDATSLSFCPLMLAASPWPSERNRAAIWWRSLDIRSIIFSATAGLYLLRLNRSSSSSIPKSAIFCRVRSVICFSIPLAQAEYLEVYLAEPCRFSPIPYRAKAVVL